MPAVRPPHTRIQRNGSRRARDLRKRLAEDVRRSREDVGISQRALARGAGVSSATICALERGTYDPTTEVLARVGEALGLDLSMRYYQGTGPLLRDHHQAAMIEGLLRIRHRRWRPSPEVWVTRPVRGVIDLVLDATDDAHAAAAAEEPIEPLIATEAQSELRRLEQQLRWTGAKADALAQARDRPTSRLLLLRNTRATRAVVAEHAATIEAAYPARTADAFTALTTTLPWPGAALLWVDLSNGRATIRPTPPRNITIGR